MPVDSTHPDYDTILPKVARVRDALDADRVKAAGATYLPRLIGDDDNTYRAYAKRGLYYGATSRTLQGVSGLVFRRATVVQIPAGQQPEEIVANVDMRGMPLDRFAQGVFDEVFAIGRAGVYVSMPQSAAPGARAYLTKYRAESIINWRVDDSGDVPRLARVVLKETVNLLDPADPYAVKPTDQYRDLFIDEHGYVTVNVYRRAEDTAHRDGGKFALVESSEPRFRGARVTEIPFIFINARSLGPDPEDPPLLPLADANLDHYRMMADYRHGLHYTALPTPYMFGGDEGDELAIGPGVAWTGSNSDIKVGMLEFSGSGLNPIKDALEASVSYMASLGARLIEADKNAAETAETHRLRQGREQATVAATVQTVNSGLTQALALMLELSGINGDAEVQCNTDLVDARLAPDELRVLVEAYQTGTIAFDTFYHNMRRGEMTRPGVTAEEEREAIDASIGAQMALLPEMQTNA